MYIAAFTMISFWKSKANDGFSTQAVKNTLTENQIPDSELITKKARILIDATSRETHAI